MPTIGSGYTIPKIVNIVIRLGHTKVCIRIDYPNGESMKINCVPEKRKNKAPIVARQVRIIGFIGDDNLKGLINKIEMIIAQRSEDRTVLEVISRLAHIATKTESIVDTVSMFERDEWR